MEGSYGGGIFCGGCRVCSSDYSGKRQSGKKPDEEHYRKQTELLNRCLSEFPKGKIIAQEKNFYILNIGEHQVVMQYVVYHVGFARKPPWLAH